MIYKKVDAHVKRSVLSVLHYYDFDSSKFEIFLNTLANNNKVFLIKNKQNKFILRQSNPSTTLQHLQLEVKVLQYLYDRKFHLTARVIPNIRSADITVVDGRYFILQNFLAGGVTKSVNNLTRFNSDKLVNFFKALASFSRAVEGFKGMISRDNKSLRYYSNNANKLYNALSLQVKNRAIKKLLFSSSRFVKAFASTCKTQMDEIGYEKLPKQIVHFDLHPGNVNFKGSILTGIFDFDWVRFDSRITDLACSIGQSCYRYRGKNKARYDVHKIRRALKSYRSAYGKSEFAPQTENKLIFIALKTYMVYQLLWIIEWHLKNKKDLEGYNYIKFSLNVLKLNNFDELMSAVSA